MFQRYGRTLFLSVLFPTLLFVAGCGGGSTGSSDEVTVSTNGSGSLSSVSLLPSAGSFITNPASNFAVRWLGTLSPPSQFSVALHRYKEGRGGEARSNDTQKIEVLNLGGNAWNVRRRDNFSLDNDGVYYLRLGSRDGQQIKAAYIVTGTPRSLQAPVQGRDIATPGTGTLAGVQLTPSAGSVFIPRDTTFTVEWTGTDTAPPRLGIDIWRYEEQRGTEARKVSRQDVDLVTITPGKKYTVRLKNRRDLAAGGVYFVELTGPGETQDIAYIITSD